VIPLSIQWEREQFISFIEKSLVMPHFEEDAEDVKSDIKANLKQRLI